MIKNAGLTPEQQKVRLADYKPTEQTMGMYRMVQRYLEEFPDIYASDAINKGLALTGSVGIGKTMLAMTITNELLERKIPTVYVTTPDLMGDLLATQFSECGNEELERKINKLATVPIAIFDDVAKEKITERVRTQYFRIVDGRYRNRLTTIITSNYGMDEIEERLGENGGDAIASRLYALTKGRQIHVRADDYRLKGN
jgi:DNA replication protein DnaC